MMFAEFPKDRSSGSHFFLIKYILHKKHFRFDMFIATNQVSYLSSVLFIQIIFTVQMNVVCRNTTVRFNQMMPHCGFNCEIFVAENMRHNMLSRVNAYIIYDT